MRGIGRMKAPLIGIVAGMGALLLLLPAASQASWGTVPGADGYIQFNVGLKIEDVSEWGFILDEECNIDQGGGDHTISAKLPTWAGWAVRLPVKKTKKGYVVPRSKYGTYVIASTRQKRTTSATYTLDSARFIEPTNTTGNCAPITCPDCPPSEPKQQKCGTVPGSTSISLDNGVIYPGQKYATFEFLDEEWAPENPFNTATTYCDDLSFWHWQSGWPGFQNPDSDSYGLKVSISSLLGFFRKLGPKQRRKCNRDPLPLPKYCSRANYTRVTKVIQLRNPVLPVGNRDFMKQTSTLSVQFDFDAFVVKGVRK